MLPEVNLWFPGAAISDQLCRKLGAARGACGPVRVFPLEDQGQILRQGLVTPKSINILAVATDMKVFNFSKGRMGIFLQTVEPIQSAAVCHALWPAHPLYQVGEDAPPSLRNTFLPGMTTYRCQEMEDGILIEAFPIPGDGAEAILERVRQAICSAGFTIREMSLTGPQLAPFRAALDDAVLAALVRTFLSLYGRGPNFEWDQTGVLLRDLGSVAPNTFAIGPGAYPAAMDTAPCIRQQEPPPPTSFPEGYLEFLHQFVEEVRIPEKAVFEHHKRL